MGNLRRIVSAIALLTIINACNRLEFVEFLPLAHKKVDKRFTKSMQIASPIDTINVPDNYRFYVCGDSHYETTAHKLTSMLRTANNDTLCQFVFHVGDIVDYKSLYPAIKNIITTELTTSPFLTALGNHDIYFDEWDDYQQHFGTAIYSFIIKGNCFSDLCICIDTASGTLGKEQKKWLENLLQSERKKHRHCIVFSHTNIWNTDLSQTPSGNFSIDETLYLTHTLTQHNVDMYICGHDHYREVMSYNGVDYITLDAIKETAHNSSYIIVSCENDNIEIEWIAQP